MSTSGANTEVLSAMPFDGLGLPRLIQYTDSRRKLDPDVARLGETEFALARAIWDSRHDGVRSSSLAEKALRDYGQLPSSAAQREQITDWLSHHGGPSKRAIAKR